MYAVSYCEDGYGPIRHRIATAIAPHTADTVAPSRPPVATTAGGPIAASTPTLLTTHAAFTVYNTYTTVVASITTVVASITTRFATTPILAATPAQGTTNHAVH